MVGGFMARILTNYGEEFIIRNGLDSGAATWRVGLYDDSTVGTSGAVVGDADDLAAVTGAEPTGASYARQPSTFSPVSQDGDAAGLTEASVNDTALSFNTTDSASTVDSWFLIISFQATGDAAATDHLIATGALSQEYDLSSVDTLDVNAGTVGVSLE